jgi:hypothetical protein
MGIPFLCWCGARLKSATESAGKKARCPRCGRLVVVPQGASGFLETDPEEDVDTRPLPIVPGPVGEPDEDEEETRPLPRADGPL